MKSKLVNYCRALILASLFTATGAWSATVTVIAIPSLAMKKDIPATIILPDACRTNNARLPVLYLLHGYSDNYKGWAARTPIKELADEYSMIVVCPDGGFSSWYFDSPVDPTIRYETFVSKELVGYIDQHYQTLPRRESRAIAGLSMGGHGAMFLAIRHPDIFSVVACMSGGVDLRPFPNNWDIAKRLGSYQEHPERWAANSVVTLAETLPPGELAISIDCGTDDFFLQVNRNLHQLLLQRKVPHDYTERPGKHEWAYWSNCIKYQMLFISDHVKR
jgi:S-formylglutathione hydrolase FrmB